MAETLREYTPIAHAASRRSQFDITLPPYVNIDRIGVDLEQTDRLCNLGGINHVRIFTDNLGKVSGYEPEVVGMTSSGQALAGKGGLSTQISAFESNSTRQLQPRFGLPHASSWINSEIKINTDETNRLISQDTCWSEGVRSSDAWAQHINFAVKRGIKETGTKHLTLGMDFPNWLMALAQYGVATVGGIMSGIDIGGMLTVVLGNSAYMNTLGFAMSKLYNQDYRFSAFFGPQFDRALILALSSLKTPLVTSIPSR